MSDDEAWNTSSRNADNILRKEYLPVNGPRGTSPSWRNERSGVSQKAVLPLLRATLGSPTAYRTLVFDPLYSCYGISPYNSYQANAKVLFSTVGRSGTSAKIPTPKSPAEQTIMKTIKSIDPMAIARKGVELTWSLTKAIVLFLARLPKNTFFYLMNPKERKEKITEIKDVIRKEVDHYWTGTKLLMADVQTARSLLGRTLSGSTLTRRERKQLLRTVTDLFRLVPFSMFILIPMMEFLLPFALRLFPNMLPSTFQDSLKAEENMKRELKSRIAMAEFFQDTLKDLAKEQQRIAGKRNTEKPDDEIASKQIETAASMLEFLERARNGEMMPPSVIIQYSTYFQDDLTLDNMPRMQLINVRSRIFAQMCKYMGITPYGSDNFLRFQLRHKIRVLKEDDQRIIFEGINSLTKMELREACQERGMRSTGLSKDAYKRSLQQWLDLSVNFNVPISLLIMSRTFFLHNESEAVATSDDAKGVAGLADAISGMDKDVLNEIILEVATSEEKKSNPDVRKIKLEVLSHQNEKIREEQAEREKKKESVVSADSGTQQSDLSSDTGALAGEEGTTPASPSETLDTAKEKSFDDTNTKIERKTAALKENIETIMEIVEEAKTTEDLSAIVLAADLSADEIEAIEQLVSADPVSKEREHLARIKSAMKKSESTEESNGEGSDHTSDETTVSQTSEESPPEEAKPAFEDGEKYAASVIEQVESAAAKEADNATSFSTDQVSQDSTKDDNNEEKHLEDPNVPKTMESETDEPEEEPEEEPEKDVVVERLKKRIENMVDKIEVQLSDAELKIGDKLHLLDKDMDGLLSKEEIAESLQQALKRKISKEEAMELVSDMDKDGDGVLTVQELIKWIDTNKLVKLESEGRDADMDRIMESRSGNQTEDDGVDDTQSDSTQDSKQKPQITE
eukprot:scaffold880_cov132-Cylindrotheca_fusiformis.AAC.14